MTKPHIFIQNELQTAYRHARFCALAETQFGARRTST